MLVLFICVLATLALVAMVVGVLPAMRALDVWILARWDARRQCAASEA